MAEEQNLNRRTFLKAGARLTALGSIVFLGIGLGRRTKNPEQTQSCRLSLPCRQCTKHDRCTDPERRSAEEMKEKENRIIK